MNINYKKMRLGFKVPIGFIPLSNACLWVLQKPYPKSASVRWILNLISIFPNFLHTAQIPQSFQDLLFRQVAKQFRLTTDGEEIFVDSTY
jgi:hypothetical protein